MKSWHPNRREKQPEPYPFDFTPPAGREIAGAISDQYGVGTVTRSIGSGVAAPDSTSPPAPGTTPYQGPSGAPVGNAPFPGFAEGSDADGDPYAGDASPDNIVPFDAGEAQQPQAMQEPNPNQDAMDIVAGLNDRLQEIMAPHADPNAPAGAVVDPVLVNKPAARVFTAPKFVSRDNKPQWSDITGGGESDHLYGPQPTVKDASQRFYQRTYDRAVNGSRADVSRYNRFSKRNDRRPWSPPDA